MTIPRTMHGATLLNNGEVLVAGGNNSVGSSGNTGDVWVIGRLVPKPHQFQEPAIKDAVLLVDASAIGAFTRDAVIRGAIGVNSEVIMPVPNIPGCRENPLFCAALPGIGDASPRDGVAGVAPHTGEVSRCGQPGDFRCDG
jgi:hypothetical protein